MHHASFFAGGIFHESVDGGRASAGIELSYDRVQAVTKDQKRFWIRFSECHVTIGGHNDRMVFCRNEDGSLTIFCDDRNFPAALSFASGGVLDEQLEEESRKLKSANRQWRLIVSGFLMAALLTMAGVWYGIRAAAVAAVAAVPISVDQEIGQRSYQTMDAGGPEVHDEEVMKAMQLIVDRLAPQASIQGFSFEVHVIQSAEVNAFCLPGGVIVVYTGLIQQAERPELVAGVMAHEMAHATLRHGLQEISQSLGLAAAVKLLLGDVQGIVVLGTDLFQLASNRSYSRVQESAADAEGVRMMHAAGLDPTSLAEFLEIMQELGGQLPPGLSWISTHPADEIRITRIREQTGTLPPQKYEPLEIDWPKVQQGAGNNPEE